MTFTLGASGDFFNGDSDDISDEDQFDPKLGVKWNPLENTTIRAAAFRVLKRTLITDQTLEPTQVAGFNQSLTTTMERAGATGAAVDQKLLKMLFGGVEDSVQGYEAAGQTLQPGRRAKPTGMRTC